MKYTAKSKTTGAAALRVAGRRLLALLLCLSVALSLLPTVFAAETEADPPGTSEAPVGTAPDYEPDPAPSVLTSRTVTAEDASPITGGSAVENTYMMEVCTGSVRGGGTADNVKYFVIYYTSGTGENAVRRSAVIFPGKDALKKSMTMASAVGNRNDRRAKVESSFGYTTDSLENRKGLGALHMDQMIFTTPEPITTVDRIQVFGRLEEYVGADGKKVSVASTWACQSMHISRVDQINGLEMYGWYSNDGYIDYKGQVIAEVVMADGGGIFHWNNSAGVFSISGPGMPGMIGLTLVNTQTAAGYGKPNHVNLEHSSQVNTRVLFRLDLADDGGSGFESLAGSYEAGSHTKVSELQFCETAALRIRYEDIYGAIREISLPLIINSLGWTTEMLGDVEIAGFAQQGDSIAISAMLPDFKRIAWVSSESSESKAVEISVGEAKAVEKTGLQYVGTGQIRDARRAKANEDMIAYTCLAVYEDSAVVMEHDGATIRYTYNPAAQQPVLSIVAGSVEGVDLDGGTETKLPLIDFQEGKKMVPNDKRSMYLLTISTDNVENAGTVGDVTLQFRYVNMNDKEVTTSPLKLRDFVDQYYGIWPGSVNDFAYRYGLRSGGTLQILLPMSGVKQFKTVSVKVDGGDEWQFKGICIYKVIAYGPRIFRWEELTTTLENGTQLNSHLRITRQVDAQKRPIFQVGTVYDEQHPPLDPKDPESGWKPGNLVQDDGKYHEFDGSSAEISSQEAFDWTDYLYYMSYEDTLQDLGFNKKRCSYEVTVKVADKKVTSTSDDCGSANLFYFQLIFENGNSGCVLANQQLEADAFRTGAEAVFYIPTTQDYGDLSSIRIIPDDQDSNSDIYDKLQIQWIKVKKQNTGKISPTWTADSESEDGLGWVGIDYRDPGSAASNRGTAGRSISEISHTFEITKTSFSTKLLISITTGSYRTELKKNGNGELVEVRDPNFEGGMSMSYHYYDHEGRPQFADRVDVIEKMNEYAGLDTKYTRMIDGSLEQMDFAVSNRDYQFRPGKTDNFFLDVNDISQIVDMQLQIKSSVVTKWCIENVAVYLVQGPGSRYINGNGEYDFKYPEGQDLLFRCTWNRPQSLTKDLQIYQKPSAEDPDAIISGSSIATVNITFNENDFPIGDEAWTSKVTREPNSKDDTVNLFIYPSMDNTATDPNSYTLLSEVMYTDTLTHSALRIGSGLMNYAVDAKGRPVFYALGLNTNYFEHLAGVNVWTDSVRQIFVPINSAVLQRVRSGVLIDSYYLTGAGNADMGITLTTAVPTENQPMQRLMLQLSTDTYAQDLLPEERDLAVAVYFSSDDAYDRELRTKYIYLTDENYAQISGGQVLELDFSIYNLKEIYGINLVTLGHLDVSIENGEILEQHANGTVSRKWSFRSTMTPTRTPARFDTIGTVSLLDLNLKTALSDGTINSGTKGPIRMTVGYLDETDNLMTSTFDDIRPYMDSSAPFQAGSSDNLRMLIPDLTELRWVEFEPLSEKNTDEQESGAVSAAWKLESLSAMVDLSGFSVTKVLDQLIVEKEPQRISLADILLAGTISIILDPDDEGNPAGDHLIPTGGYLDLPLFAGEGVLVVPTIQGSQESVSVALNRLDSATGGLGRADLSDTRGYTAELLEQNALAAEQNGNFFEAAVWRSVVPDEGYWNVEETYYALSNRTETDSVVFIPPRNYTSSVICYRITITSKENTSAEVYVNLTVSPETNPVDALLAEARAKDQEAKTDHEHSITYTAPVDATCTQDGHIAYYSCAGCGKYFADALGEEEITREFTVIPALGHNYGDWTEGANDSHFRTCSRCGDRQTQSCSYGQWQYFDDTSHIRSCSTCGHQVYGRHVKSSLVADVPPTTSQHGYKMYYCNVCHSNWEDPDSYVDPLPVETTESTENPEPPPDTTDPGDSPGTTEQWPGSTEAAAPPPAEEAALGGVTRRKEGAPHV